MKIDERFNIELLEAELQAREMSIREFARQVGVSHPTVRKWLMGSMPGKDRLRKIGEVLEMDPAMFISYHEDILSSWFTRFMYKVFLMENSGAYEVKITLSSITRALKELGIFDTPEEDPPFPPDPISEAVSPLEEIAKENTELHSQITDEEKGELFLRQMMRKRPDLVEEIYAETTAPKTEG